MSGSLPPGMAAAPAPTVSDLSRMRRGDDDEAIDFYLSPFAGIEKSSVLQEASALFNDPRAVKDAPQKCVAVITKLLFLLSQGEKFVGNEASDVFFAVTKLFQSQDLALRRMVYLFLKEVAETTQSGEIIIVTASLTKDMNSPVDMFRANSIRVLCKIVEANMLAQIERYLKQAMVDKDDQVAAAALMSADQLAQSDPAKRKVVSNWLPEIQSALTSPGSSHRLQSVQYNALSVLYRIKQHDRLAVSKLVAQLTSSPSALGSNAHLASCLLVRYTNRLLHDDFITAAESQTAFKFLESCLRHRSDMVVYEAARSICRLPGVTDNELVPAINVLIGYLKSSNTLWRFAAARTLSEISMRNPIAVSRANSALEGLIQDRNRTIATMAITTLLKTGSEASVEPLTKQIAGFMSELADEFKIVVVNAIRALALKYKRKHRMLLSFLSGVLRDEGGLDFKRTIVETVLEIVDKIPEAAETGLLHLCEFIEDCEFTQLSTNVLHVLGERGPHTSNPAKLMRYVYNRVNLENAHVRAAAVSTLGAFATRVPSLTQYVIPLLKHCQADDDDEVRDRATQNLALISRNSSETADRILFGGLPMEVRRLEAALTLELAQLSEGELRFDTLPKVAEKEMTDHQRLNPALAQGNQVGGASLDAAAAAAVDPLANASAHLHDRAPDSLEALKAASPLFSTFGPLLETSEAIELTERETEYLVRVVKHVFAQHVVLQFNLTNTLNDQLLKRVYVKVAEELPQAYKIVAEVPVDSLPYDVTKSAYVALERREPGVAPNTSFGAVLHFDVLDIDPESPAEDQGLDDDLGYAETYPVNDLELGLADFMTKSAPPTDFKATWEKVGDEHEVREQFGLPDNDIGAAVKSIVKFLNLTPCENTGVIPTHVGSKHILLLSGMYLGSQRVLCHAVLTLVDKSVVLKIAIRSDAADLSGAILEALNG